VGILLYPYFLVVFWYRVFLPGTVGKSVQVLDYFSNLLSFRILIVTFFKPLKNEYREDLVVFSRVVGIVVKTLIIVADSLVLAIVFVVLLAVNSLVLLMPLILIEFCLTGFAPV